MNVKTSDILGLSSAHVREVGARVLNRQLEEDTTLAVSYARALLQQRRTDPNTAYAEAGGFVYCIREWPLNFDRRATVVNLNTARSQLQYPPSRVETEFDIDQHTKVWSELESFVSKHS